MMIAIADLDCLVAYNIYKYYETRKYGLYSKACHYLEQAKRALYLQTLRDNCHDADILCRFTNLIDLYTEFDNNCGDGNSTSGGTTNCALALVQASESSSNCNLILTQL
jgi:hypothetical protein